MGSGTDRIGGILLAAGASRRMGTLKQLLPWGPGTVLEQCLRAFCEAQISPVTVVLGFDAAAIRDRLAVAFATDDVRVVVNDRHEEGMLTSVQCGLRDAQAAGADAVLIALVDQPFVPHTVFRRLVDAYRESERHVVVPTVQGRRGHPIILSLGLASAVHGMDAQSGGLRELLQERRDDVLLLPIDADEVLRDMDVPDEYRRERDAWLGAGSPPETETSPS